jgi:cobalt-zinc-cadmium efflux system membrane fusion protein
MKIGFLLFVLIYGLLSSACAEKETASKAHSSEEKSGRQEDTKAKSGQKEEKEGNREAANQNGREAVVELSLAAQRGAKLIVRPVANELLAEVITLNGTVQPVAGRVGVIQPLARGRVTDVLVRIGDQVHLGQTLARVDNIEAGELVAQYNAAQAELARLKIQLAILTRQAERSRNLLTIGAVSVKEADATEAERRGQEELIRAQESTLAGLDARLHRFGLREPSMAASLSTTINAPFSGVVTSVQAAPGAVVDPNSQLFAIADLSTVYVAGQVYERDLSRVFVGQSAKVTVAAYPEVRFSGRVVSIGTSLDPTTRTAPVRCEVTNPGNRLRLDMFAQIELPAKTRREALAVPLDAVQQVDAKPAVFVEKDETHFAVRPIQLGRAVDGWIEVTSGLKLGESVVMQGAFQVKSALLGGSLGEEGEK